MSAALPVSVTELQESYLPLRAHALVRSDIDGVCDGFVADSQAQVSDGAHSVLLNQDVLRFEVTVSNARFTCRGHVVSSEQ